MERVKIARISHPWNWWSDCVGQESPVLEVYEPTGFIKIRVVRTEPDFPDQPYTLEGWISPKHVDYIED